VVRVGQIFADLGRQLLKAFQKIEGKIHGFVELKMGQKTEMTSFKNKLPTFTSDESGNYDHRVDQFVFDPLFQIPFGSRDILVFGIEHPVITLAWRLMVFEPPIPNPWQFRGRGNGFLEDQKDPIPYASKSPIKPESELERDSIIVPM